MINWLEGTRIKTKQVMADTSDSTSGGSWWGGWLQTAKEKSTMALEFMKKDLTEFSEVMQKDTVEVASSVKEKLSKEQATAATKKVKDGMTTFLGGISKVLTIPPDDEYQPLVKTATGVEPIYDRSKARLMAIQLDPETYLREPQGSRDEYDAWLKDFNLEERKGDISELLVANADVRLLYTQMVPSQVSHSNYWQRYFYKVFQLEQDKKRRADLMKRADDTESQQLEWDDMEEWDDVADSDLPKKTDTEKAESAAEKVPSASIPEVAPAADTEVNTGKTDEEPRVPDPHQPIEMPSESSPSTEDDRLSECPKVDVSEESTETPSGASSPEMLPSPSQATEETLKVKDKGDMVYVGSADRNTPSSDSTNKESSSLDDDWEKEFDLEVTEEDLRLAQEAAKMLKEKGVIADGDDGDDNEWENWD